MTARTHPPEVTATGRPAGRSGTRPPPTAELAGPVLAPPPKLRRRPILIAVSVAAVCLGALLSAWAYSSTSHAQDVIGMRNTVLRGDTITRADLASVKISVDPALTPVPASQLEAIVGQRAAMDLPVGGVLTAAAVTTALTPPAGQSIVGIAAAPGMMPALRLRVGDTIRIVSTPGQQGTVSAAAPPSLTGLVVDLSPAGDNAGSTIVNVQVPAADAAQLAARVATGKIAIVLDSRQR